jgi:hypothetical protein
MSAEPADPWPTAHLDPALVLRRSYLELGMDLLLRG